MTETFSIVFASDKQMAVDLTSNPGLKAGAKTSKHDCVWQPAPALTKEHNKSKINSHSLAMFPTPEGSNIHTPGFQAGDKNPKCESVWRPLCALAKRMTNTHPYTTSINNHL